MNSIARVFLKVILSSSLIFAESALPLVTYTVPTTTTGAPAVLPLPTLTQVQMTYQTGLTTPTLINPTYSLSSPGYGYAASPYGYGGSPYGYNPYGYNPYNRFGLYGAGTPRLPSGYYYCGPAFKVCHSQSNDTSLSSLALPVMMGMALAQAFSGMAKGGGGGGGGGGGRSSGGGYSGGGDDIVPSSVGRSAASTSYDRNGLAGSSVVSAINARGGSMGNTSLGTCNAASLDPRVQKCFADAKQFQKDCSMTNVKSQQYIIVNDYCSGGTPQMYIQSVSGGLCKTTSTTVGIGASRTGSDTHPLSCSSNKSQYTPSGMHLAILGKAGPYTGNPGDGQAYHLSGLEGQGSNARGVEIHYEAYPGSSTSEGCSAVGCFDALRSLIGNSALVNNCFCENSPAAPNCKKNLGAGPHNGKTCTSDGSGVKSPANSSGEAATGSAS